MHYAYVLCTVERTQKIRGDTVGIKGTYWRDKGMGIHNGRIKGKFIQEIQMVRWATRYRTTG